MIRFFCRPTELALSCVKAFHDMHWMVRILPIGAIDFTGRDAITWNKYSSMFVTPMTDDYVNVVCCEEDGFAKLLTAGVINIAVTPDETPNGYDGCAFEPAELVGLLVEHGQ